MASNTQEDGSTALHKPCYLMSRILTTTDFGVLWGFRKRPPKTQSQAVSTVFAVQDPFACTSVPLPRLLDWPRKPLALFLVWPSLADLQDLAQAGLNLQHPSMVLQPTLESDIPSSVFLFPHMSGHAGPKDCESVCESVFY